MFAKLRDILHHHFAHRAMNKMFHGTHAAYFGLVFFEGHGMYALAGGALMAFTILDWFLHFE